MRVAISILALCCAAGSALGQAQPEFQQPCSSHVQSTWSEDMRKAALTDCSFYEEAQRDGAAAWVKYAAADAAMSGINGREQIRAAFEKSYAVPGFRLLWHPTGGSEFGNFVVTNGSYERYSLDKDGKQVISHGHYVTVWQKQKDGSFLYIFDGGE